MTEALSARVNEMQQLAQSLLAEGKFWETQNTERLRASIWKQRLINLQELSYQLRQWSRKQPDFELNPTPGRYWGLIFIVSVLWFTFSTMYWEDDWEVMYLGVAVIFGIGFIGYFLVPTVTRARRRNRYVKTQQDKYRWLQASFGHISFFFTEIGLPTLIQLIDDAPPKSAVSLQLDTRVWESNVFLTNTRKAKTSSRVDLTTNIYQYKLYTLRLTLFDGKELRSQLSKRFTYTTGFRAHRKSFKNKRSFKLKVKIMSKLSLKLPKGYDIQNIGEKSKKADFKNIQVSTQLLQQVATHRMQFAGEDSKKWRGTQTFYPKELHTNGQQLLAQHQNLYRFCMETEAA
ncbi:hypothetical protein [Eisenibacter elegans]|uniref:hypothetical protein n=1 Tax=Eisenibacter elegans TaxID=997 RepID=UPI00047E489C|nr:hypothetical protein [Eisenibacter elegans]